MAIPLLPPMNVLASRILGVRDAAQAWERLRGYRADLPDVHPLLLDHMMNFQIRAVRDVQTSLSSSSGALTGKRAGRSTSRAVLCGGPAVGRFPRRWCGHLF
jgi:hypothetical protein